MHRTGRVTGIDFVEEPALDLVGRQSIYPVLSEPRKDVELDVSIRILLLEEQNLCDHEVRERIRNLITDEDDAVAGYQA